MRYRVTVDIYASPRGSLFSDPLALSPALKSLFLAPFAVWYLHCHPLIQKQSQGAAFQGPIATVPGAGIKLWREVVR